MKSYTIRITMSALIAAAIGAPRAFAACPFASGLFAGEDDNGIDMPTSHDHEFLRRALEPDGLLNEGKGCFGFCNKTAGDCDYCGTGQCCRSSDYSNGVEGCELAKDVIGAKCGLWKGEPPDLRNEGLACFGACDNTAGDCGYCGISGQCCRKIDGERCVPGCELAALNWIEGGPASQCGYFSSTECVPTADMPAPPPPTTDATGEETVAPSGGLLHEGESCGGRCNFEAGDCDWCGTGQCCSNNDWYRGVPGCELAEGQAVAVCGDFSAPYPEPAEFRLGMPLGTAETPESVSTSEEPVSGGWIRDIVPEGDNIHDTPEYNGEGGKPWSEFEMSLVRDIIRQEIRRASPGRDEVSGAKFLRLAFHDCLQYTDGEGGCDGCLNWDMMGNVLGGENGRVEDREYEDFERKQSNNGLQHVVAFLEHVYNLDFGHTYGSGCWMTPATVAGAAWVADTRENPIWVTSEEECEQLCLDTEDCTFFTVPQLQFLNSRGPCRLFSEDGTMRSLTTGRLIAGRANCPHESWSLRSRGKSRADLWAFASLVAVEEGIERHNYACDGDRRSPHGGPIMCTQFEGEETCKINPVRPFVFKTGRKDCDSSSMDEPFKTNKIEAFPDEHFNGTMTVRFMEEHFGFSGKETVAIMGAHTMGRFNQQQTGHKYVWTSDFQAFNNQFYRNIAGRADWFFDDDECTKVGDAWGNKGQAVWIAKMNQVYRTGAPIQWIQKKVVCPNCADLSYERGGRHPDRLAQDRDCCLNKPEGAQCRPDGFGPIGSTALERDDDFSDGCEYSHFIFGNDEAAMGSDMGLFYRFDVDIRGFPSGCPGLATFYPSASRFSDWTCGIDGRPWFENPELSWDDPNLSRVTENDWTEKGCPADCSRQDYKYPGDEMSLADHVDRYADDQAAWINDYIPGKFWFGGYIDEKLVGLKVALSDIH